MADRETTGRPLPTRLKMSRQLIVLLALFTSAVMLADRSIAAADGGPSNGGMMHEQSESTARPGSAEVVPEGFGRWELRREFGPAAGTAVSGQIFTFDVATERVALVDVRTGDYVLGAKLPGVATAIEVTDDGRWGYVSWQFPSSRAPFEIDGIERIALNDIDSTSSIELPEPVAEYRDGVFGVLPGVNDTLIVMRGGRIALVRSGELMPSVLTDGRWVSDVAAISEQHAFLAIDNTVHEVSLDGEGVVATRDTGLRVGSEDMTHNDGQVVVGSLVLDVGGTTPRLATEFERARPDPTLPIRYFGRSGFRPTGAHAKVFDEVSGDELARAHDSCIDFNGSVLVGDGYLVSPGPSTGVVNLVDACGSYGEFTPVEPQRVLDTRTGMGLSGGPRQISAGETLRVKVHGLADVPDEGVESVVLNVTGLRQSGSGAAGNFLTVWPAGFDRPTVSNLNIRDGEIVGNMVTVSTAAGGFVDVYSNSGSVGLTVDVMGYFASALAPGGARFAKVRNQRLLDTREFGGILGESDRLTIDVPRGDPYSVDYATADIVAAVVNVTALQPTRRSHLRIFPTGSPLPDASSMNFEAGTNTNRLVTVKVTNGRFDIWNSEGTTGLTVDLVGVYVDGEHIVDGGRFVGIVPERRFDSRVESPFDEDGSIDDFSLVSLGGYRRGIDLVGNVTAIRPTQTGFVSTGPWTGIFEPFLETSSLNFRPGNVVANQVIAHVGDAGEVGIFNGPGSTHVALDLFGFYIE